MKPGFMDKLIERLDRLDSGSIQDQFGPVGVSGFFGNGEFGPVGGVNFVHGYTAALGVFTNKPKV